ncbi:hypothetical protein AB0M02_19080 [Actinoplanes sp. NPDC051861]|uniref:hypothetical protein n=1 Tax=Actinoplanes sp. NPDC051861 TaxID=3155170 RepID=UPI0034400088
MIADGQRLLRFLTSLALLALAVTLRLSGPAAVTPAAAPDPAPPAAAVTSVTRPAPAEETTASSDTAAPAPERHRPEFPATATAATVIAAAPQHLPAGEAPQGTAPRAPPAV